MEQKRYKLQQSPFYRMKSKKKLADLLQIGVKALDRCAALSEKLYWERDILQKNRRKSRHIEEPREGLKKIQRRLHELLKRIQIPEYIQSPNPGYSYTTNVKAHINQKVTKSLDIKEHFISTPKWRIYDFFYKRMECCSDIAGILAAVTTFKGHLPTGSPSSPILCYFAYMDMWESVYALVKDAKCIVTIYMDDVTISGYCVPDKLVHEIKQEFRRFNLHDNPTKEKHYDNNESREINNLILKKSGKIVIPNRQHLKMHELRRDICSEPNHQERRKKLKSLRGMELHRQYIESL